jgi:hypothetical protein
MNANSKESKLPVESVSFLVQMKYGYMEMAELNKQIVEEMHHLESESLYTTEQLLKSVDE